MKHLVFIALGGAFGALARYWLYVLVHGTAPVRFPWATLAVNCLGSFAIGIAYVLIVERGAVHPDWRSVAMIGFLGAFTTMSAFSLDIVLMWERKELVSALLYVASTVGASVAAVLAGLMLMRRIAAA